MSDTKRYPCHTTGVNDDVLVTMSQHHVSFEVHYFQGKVLVHFGWSCGMHLSIEQARALRQLLDLGIADALDAQESAGARVDLVKAAA